MAGDEVAGRAANGTGGQVPDLPAVDSPVHLHDPSSSYHCRVEEIGGGSLLLVPNSEVTGPPPAVGTALTLSWASLRGSSELPVRFTGVEALGGRQAWRLKATGAPKLIQRRRYTRAAVEAPVEFVNLGAGGQEIIRGGWLLDISEGGARCTFPLGQIDEGEKVEFRCELDGPLEVDGEVLRVTAREGRAYVVVTFDAPVQVADRIRKYVFAMQLAERRRLAQQQ